MKRTLIAAAILSFVFALSAFAAEDGQQPNAPAATFAQRQAHILKIFDDRMAALQAAKICVQTATDDNDLKACRKKYMGEMRERRGETQQSRGMTGGPQGQ